MTDTPSSHLRFKRKHQGAALRIGILAERTGATVATIRYCEQIGLLRPATRSGGQRTHDHEDVRRLSFIRRCREFDFPNRRHSRAVVIAAQWQILHRRLAESRLVELRRRRVELQGLESTIASLVTAYANTCDGGGAPDCVILQAP
jgi:DNA-binding transcriptional MerR regulator